MAQRAGMPCRNRGGLAVRVAGCRGSRHLSAYGLTRRRLWLIGGGPQASMSRRATSVWHASPYAGSVSETVLLRFGRPRSLPLQRPEPGRPACQASIVSGSQPRIGPIMASGSGSVYLETVARVTPMRAATSVVLRYRIIVVLTSGVVRLLQNHDCGNAG